ncbi:hypothetical protein [uncultured Sunxiuqinia sp.]|uniref:hypothetical protein n=1 Tax=uncultured Sunxiuqinia sp. TaxID=1573825 RepID=UPI002AA8D8C2|nr:hypothetical protein [uncultured Sunxiuqinia sp.]
MMKSFTLSYFFNTYHNDQFSLKKIDSRSREENDMITEMSERLFSPSEKSVQQILDFSKSYEVLNSRMTNSIELIKN